MIIAIFVSFVALLFAFFGSKNKNFKGLEIAFLILTLFSCMRYNYGTDYKSYMNEFYEINRYSINYILDNKAFKDKGWFVIQSFMYPIGWFPFVALISIYCNFIYYKFIKKYVPFHYYWLSFFIYAFTFDMFMLQQSMIRQGLAIALMLSVYILLDDLDFKHKHKLFGALLITAIAISIHKSAAFTVPFTLFKLVPMHWWKFMAIGLISLFFGLFIIKEILEIYLEEILLMEAFESFGSDYGNEEGNDLGVLHLLGCIPIFVSGYYLTIKRTEKGHRFMVAISMIAPMIWLSIVSSIGKFNPLLASSDIVYPAIIILTYFTIVEMFPV